jgi:hypothetical protein
MLIMTIALILYSKTGCHLCEGLEEKLRQITTLNLAIEIRDITTQANWFAAYQYEIPVLYQMTDQGEILIPRPSPRATVGQLTQLLQKHLDQAR